ncbi:hypothetical protein DYU11_11595 [Fibrisoma montanum]|uniref:Uncharacterized protein n=1 Tax=Fibrisoma montanum TaxID=2305895 RepID=A0A418MB76_9BACT|nr:hypothetical protein [Fibrisoma montanum]RIV23618.1 hypothetical protein DYU11_11595 [Fibrisoma montanum]
MPFTAEDAHALVRETINTSLRHAGYTRTVDLRTAYMTIYTGQCWPDFLSRFTRREDEQAFKQRLDLTFQNLSSVASPVVKKFGQISRIQDLKKGLNFEGTTDRDQRDLTDVLDNFRAEGLSRKGSLDDYLSQVYDTVSLYDPNAFIVLEFAPFRADLGERARPYAVLYESPQVYNFRYTRGELDFLLVALEQSFKTTENKTLTLTDLILYSGPFQVRYYQLHDDVDRIDIPDGENWVSDAAVPYRMAQFAPMVEETPAVRLGDLPDAQTHGLTVVSRAFHSALDQFRELMNVKSRSDLVSWLHGFPRLTEYALPCPGEIENGYRVGCNEGRHPTSGQKCRECGGTGFQAHRSEQDRIRFPLTQNMMASEMLKLSELSHTDKPDWETVNGFVELVEGIQSKIYLTIFSTDYQLKTSGQIAIAKTATEVAVTRDDINNTLLPYADQKSVVYKAIVRHTASLMNVSGEVKPLYEFPRDLKMASIGELQNDLKLARESNAPAFLIEQILDDIARKTYESDPTALHHYFIKKQHIPYFALTLEEFEYFDSTGRIPADMAVLWANSDIIFGELEISSPTFYDLPYAERDALVMEKVRALQARLPQGVSMSRIGQQPQEVEG